MQKEWELGRRVAYDLEKRDGSVQDGAMLGYVQELGDRLARAAGIQGLQIRLTLSSTVYASLLPNRMLYLSAGLLDLIGDEAELAGLAAHELAHQAQGQRICVLTSPSTRASSGDPRYREVKQPLPQSHT